MSSPPSNSDTNIEISKSSDGMTTVSVSPDDLLRFTEVEIEIELTKEQWIDISGMVQIRGTVECEEL